MTKSLSTRLYLTRESSRVRQNVITGPNGTGMGGDAAFCGIGLPGRDYPVFHKSDQAEICKNALPDFFLRFLRAGTCITLPGNWGI